MDAKKLSDAEKLILWCLHDLYIAQDRQPPLAVCVAIECDAKFRTPSPVQHRGEDYDPELAP